MRLPPVVPDNLITVHDVVTNVAGVQVPYPNVLISPKEEQYTVGDLCRIPFSREKPHLEVKVMELPEGNRLEIGFGETDTLRSSPGWCIGTWGYCSEDGNVYKYCGQVSHLGSFRQGDVILMSFHPGIDDYKGVLTVKKNGVQVGKIELDVVIPIGFPFNIGPSSWMIGFSGFRMDKAPTVVHFSTMS